MILELFSVLKSTYHRLYLVDDILIYKNSIALLESGVVVLFIHGSHVERYYNCSIRGIYYNPNNLDIRKLVKDEKKNRVKLKSTLIY